MIDGIVDVLLRTCGYFSCVNLRKSRVCFIAAGLRSGSRSSPGIVAAGVQRVEEDGDEFILARSSYCVRGIEVIGVCWCCSSEANGTWRSYHVKLVSIGHCAAGRCRYGIVWGKDGQDLWCGGGFQILLLRVAVEGRHFQT
jgi:hypothetical protein